MLASASQELLWESRRTTWHAAVEAGNGKREAPQQNAGLTTSRWPSIVWQLFWSWIYAPVLLYRVRKIHDVHGWRKQTIACVVAGYVFIVHFTTPSLTIDQTASITNVVDCTVRDSRDQDS